MIKMWYLVGIKQGLCFYEIQLDSRIWDIVAQITSKPVLVKANGLKEFKTYSTMITILLNDLIPKSDHGMMQLRLNNNSWMLDKMEWK
jgi:hypothetical protein